MAVTINAKGTSVSSFQIGKGGVTITADADGYLTIADGAATQQPLGFNTIPIYEIDAADTFDLAHAGMMWHKDANAAVTFMCDDDATIPQGSSWAVHNDDTEDLTIAQGAGVTINFLSAGAAPVAGNVTVEQGGVCTVYKYTDTEYWVWGDVAAFVPAAAATVTVANEAADTTSFPLFVTAATGDLGPKTNAGLTFDAATATLGATQFSGGGAGLTALTAANISSGNLGSAVLPYSTAVATNSNFQVPFVNTTGVASGNFGLQIDTVTPMTYNPSTNTLVAGTFSGSGASLTALTAANISSGNLGSGVLPYATAVATNSAFQVPFLNTTGVASGNFGLQIDTVTPMTYNPSTGTLTTTTFVGALSGNATTATTATTATNVTVAASASATGSILFTESATGNLPPKSDAGLTYNATTNALTTTTFVGALSGNASTATTAAQWTTTRTINMTGDVTSDAVNIDGSGNITITNTVVANDSHTHDANNLTGTILNSGVVTSSLTTVGTIGTGVWQGTTIDETFGGTGQTTLTTGDLLYASAANTFSKLALGNVGEVLTVVGSNVAWNPPAVIEFAYSSTTTAADPGAGTIRFNSVTIGSITTAYIDDLDASGDNAEWILSNLANGDVLTFRSVTDAADYIVASVNGTTTDGTGYWTVPLTLIHTGTIFTNGDQMRVSVEWQSQAGGGATVNVGTVEGHMLRWDNTAGEWDPTTNLIMNAATNAKMDFYGAAGATLCGSLQTATGPAKLQVLDADGNAAVDFYGTLTAFLGNPVRFEGPNVELANTARSQYITFDSNTTSGITLLSGSAKTALVFNGLDIGVAGQANTGKPTAIANTALIWCCSDGAGEALYNRAPNLSAPLDNLHTASWRFNTPTAAADPAATLFRLNSATPASVTALYIDDTDAMSEDGHWFLSNIEVGDVLTLRTTASRDKYGVYTVNSVADNTGWWTIGVTIIDVGSTIYTNVDHVQFELQKTSAVTAGNVSNTGTPVNNQLAVWTDATTIEGDANLTWDGSTLTVDGTIISTSNSGIVIDDAGSTESLTIRSDGTDIFLEVEGGTTDVTLGRVGSGEFGTFNILADIAITGNVRTNASAGAQVMNETASGTNPTLIPRRDDVTTGVGASATGTISLVTSGSEAMSLSTTAVTVNEPLLTLASATGAAGLNIPEGTAPTAPNDGDVWVTATGEFFARLNGVSTDLASGGVPTAITVANEAADTTSFPLFVTAATGDLGPKTNAGLTYNASTSDLNSTLIAGIANANLVDKSAAEVITGVWTFPHSTRIRNNAGSTQLFFDDAADDLRWRIGVSGAAGDDFIIYDEDAAVARLNIDDTTGAFSLIGAVGITGALTATSYGGITEANLVDKAATEAITGAWTLSNASNSFTGSGAGLTALTAANISSGNLGSAVLPYSTAVATNSNFQVPFVNTTGVASGNFGLQIDTVTPMTYNPSTNTLVAGTFSGAHSGSGASLTALTAANISSGNLGSGVLPYSTATATSSAFVIPFLNTTGVASGNFGLQLDTGASFTYNPSTNAMTVGSITTTGNITVNNGSIDVDQDETIGSTRYTLYNTNSDVALQNLGTGAGSDTFFLMNNSASYEGLVIRNLGAVELYHADVLTFETSDRTASDHGTGARVLDGVGTFQPVGFNTMPIYEIDVNDSFDLAHNGMVWHKDANASVTFMCDNDATIPQGATYLVHNDDTEDLTIAQGSGVTIEFLSPGAAPATGNVTVKQGGIVTVYKYSDTVFWVWGAADTISSSLVTVTTSTTSSAFKVPFANTTVSTTGSYGLLQDSTATFTYNPSTNTLVAGTFSGSGASLTSIPETAITDGTILARRQSAEAITGAWTFGTAAQVELLGGTDLWIRDAGFLRIYNSGDTDHVQFSHDGTDFNIAGTNTTDINITGITAINAGAVDADFDVITATSYGGITEANLVDKSATETITGIWTLDAAVSTSDYGTGGRVKDGTDVSRPIGFNVMPVYEIDVADTFDLAHNGMLWHTDGTGTIAFTCANEPTIPFGATYTIVNEHTSGTVTVSTGSVTLRWFQGTGTPTTGTRTLAIGAVATVYKYTDTVFWIWGTGIS